MSTLNTISLVLLYGLVILLFLERKRQKEKKEVISNQFLSGYGMPNKFFGKNGDTYLDYSTGNIYSKKQNTWL